MIWDNIENFINQATSISMIKHLLGFKNNPDSRDIWRGLKIELNAKEDCHHLKIICVYVTGIKF